MTARAPVNPAYGSGVTINAAAAAPSATQAVPAGAQVVVTRSAQHDTLAYVSTAGTTLHVMNGEGF